MDERTPFLVASNGPERETAPPTEDPDVEVEEQPEPTSGAGTDRPWRVILFNDEVHTFDEVIGQLVKATGCSPSRAERLAWQVHTRGKASVYEGDFEDCLQVQTVLREIQLVTEIQG
jgi:ATP-dependent Clp protease adapter protein ClpS